ESVTSGKRHPDYVGEKGEAEKPPDKPVDTLTIRNQKWRFTFYTGISTGELYDLESDPNEFTNRWDDPSLQNTKSELMVELLNRVAGTRDPLPFKEKPY
ncbi:MAG: sulfatase/phosphatase domain-containing protein, partial [bacterium]